MQMELVKGGENDSKRGENDSVGDADLESEQLINKETDTDRCLPVNMLKSMLSRFRAKKGDEEGTGEDKSSLKKELTLFSGIMYVVGNVVGAGIFITPRTILNLTGSFALSLTMWLVGGIMAVAGALCYIELGLLIRKSGGEYNYLKAAYSFKKYKVTEVLGDLLGFLLIWSSICVTKASLLAVITLTCSRYLIRPFFIGCEYLPETAVKLSSLAILGK